MTEISDNPEVETQRFRLYVAGRNDLSMRAIKNLQQTCEQLFGSDFEIDVVDILEAPNVARELRIIATPMVWKWSPGPEFKLLGDLSDREVLAESLKVRKKYTEDQG